MLTEHIVSATAIAEVIPGGQKITKIAVEYDTEIDGTNIEPAAFGVKGREVTEIYTSSSELGDKEPSGKFVIIKMDVSKTNGNTFFSTRKPGPPPAHKPGEKPMGPPPIKDKTVRLKIREELSQCSALKTVSGEMIAPDGYTFDTDKSRQLVVEDFKQLIFDDPENGEFKYCLYIPKDYDGTKKYPLVNYIPDGTGCSNYHDFSIVYTYGAISFAEPEAQEKHPAFVLVPQVPEGPLMTNDEFQCTPTLDAIIRLIDKVIAEYSIDTDRVYTTGQSMGCMASFEMLLRRPDLFAGALLVAGQWDPVRVGTLKDRNLWIVVSEGDHKAYPINNAATAEMEKNGGKVSRSYWSANMTGEHLENAAKSLIAEGNNVLYTVLNKETVAMHIDEHNPVEQHMTTWKMVYPMKPLHDWLFNQKKN